MDEISSRKELILRAVVLEYVETAEPVGSQALVNRYRIGVGPATIRNEMAEMSERGLLEQPHTSAGRIPSDAGYKYFVEHLVGDTSANVPGKEIRELARTEMDLDTLLREACRLLTRLSRYASVATTLNTASATIKQITLTGVTPTRAILLVVLSNGEVHDLMVESSPDITLAEQHEVSARLTLLMANKPLRQVSRLGSPEFPDLSKSVAQLAARSWKVVKNAARSLSGARLVREGTQYLLAEPEFQRDLATLTQLVHAIEDAETIQDVLERGRSDSPTVSIGRDHAADSLKRVAFITSRFFVSGEEAGAIAIVGPTRMRYEQAIPLVEQAARALSDALTRMVH